MYKFKGDKNHIPSAYSRRSSNFIDRDFQMKYTRKAIWICLIGSLVFLTPVFYFTIQNYDLFIRLSMSGAADLLPYLERERALLLGILIASIAGQITFLLIIGRQLTAKVIAPIRFLKNHMRYVSRGDFSQPPLQLRDGDEFEDLVMTYNYLFASLKVKHERDLKGLLEAKKHANHSISSEILNEMIEARKAHLGIQNTIELTKDPNASHDEESAPSHGSRHAS